jgi:hypothetical protein
MGLSVPHLGSGENHETANHNHRPGQIKQKEKSHVVDYHRNSNNLVAARIFRSEYKSKISENWQLDSRSDRYRRHTHHIEPPRGAITLLRFEDL